MRPQLKSANIFLVAFSVLLLIACGGGGGGGGDGGGPPAPPPPASDLSGSWWILGASTGGNYEGIATGEVSFDEAGSVTDGEYEIANWIATLTGGSIAVSEAGVLTGTINTNVGVNVSVISGKIDAGNAVASFVDYTNDGEWDLVTAIKRGSSYNQSDLQGTWHIFGLSSGGTNEGSIYCRVDINSSGSATGSYTHSNGTIASINSGTLTMNDFARGTLTTDAGVTMYLEGVLDASKYIGFFYVATNLAEFDFFMAIKAGGVFNTTDLAGTWYFFLGSSGGANEGVSYGTIILNITGNVTGGYYWSGGSEVSINGGSVTMDVNGVLDGTVTAIDGSVIDLLSGKMNYQKTMMTSIGQTNLGGPNIIIAYKGS